MSDEPQPLPLVRRADLRESWFDAQQARDSSTSIAPPPPSLPSIARTLVGGCVVGAVAGAAFVGVASLVAHRFGLGDNVARTFGAWLSRGALVGNAAVYSGVGFTAGIGLVLGVLLSLMTRHVRRGFPMMLFGVLFAPALWLAMHVFVLRRYAPARAAALPFLALVVGAAAFGACFGLLPAMRGRGGSS